ncbi:MAG: hypothetical protein P1P82_00425 [Bacteroidales bacterium]|nr:hypothetical protein [Bacteroidales bacterium]MDT8430020.1 hypothetical protein [Bacteroidales bacterium]
MNKKFPDSVKVLILLSLFLAAGVSGCNSGNKKAKDADAAEEEFITAMDDETQEKLQTAKRIFYSLPSPIETAKILQSAGATYDETLLNPIRNQSGYITNLDMALNLGIYTTDLSYASLFDQTQTTLNYIEVARNMADGLNILDAINESTIQRLEDNINNREIIIDIISETLLNSSSYLKERGLESTATIILVGGWVEGLYIATQLAGNEPIENNKIVERIVDQKLSVDFMINLLKEAADDPDAGKVLEDVMNLKATFDKIEINLGENTPVVDPETNVTTLKSSSSHNLTKPVFDELVNKVTIIRNSYIS